MNFVTQFVKVAKKLSPSYTLKGENITAEKAFADDYLLPGLMRRADQLSSFCIDQNLGLSFVPDNKSPTGVKVLFDETVSNTWRLLCALDALIEIVQSAKSPSKVPLDDLADD